EKALLESERKLTTLIGNLQGMAYRCGDAQGWPMEFVSVGCRELTGYSPDELINGSVKYEEIIHPGDRKMVREIVHEGRKRGVRFDIQYRIITKSRQVRWVWERGVFIESGEGEPEIIEGFISDVTARKDAEEALRESERQKDLILNASSEMIAYHDKQLRVIWANRVSGESVGESPDDLVGRHCYEIWHQRTDPCPGCPVLKARDTGISHQMVQQTPDGRYFRLRGYPVFNESMDVVGMVEFGQDITEEVIREKEQKRLQEELNQARKMESVGRLAGGVAHDFNNLLTVITGHTSMLLSDSELSDKLREELIEISRAGERAADLTRQLLAYSRRQILEARVININKVIGNLNRMLNRLLGEDIRLVTELDENLWNIKADPVQMEQIVVNLAVNAREAMPDGGNLTIRTANAEIDNEVPGSHIPAESGDYVRISITDTGAGMDEQTREQIFEPFFTTKGLGKGTGLGLSTVYGIVKQSGGYIMAESEPDKGTTFNIYLPRSGEAAEPEESEERMSRNNSGSEKLLVVEDDQKVLDMTCRMLESRGYELFSALGAEKAIGIFREHGDSIQMILTDVVMPEKDGKELADSILSENPDVKVLFMSGYTDDEVLRRGVYRSGAHFLQKPFTPQQLAGKVREVLDGEAETTES
ncbi:MAG: PAS domain-containing protein, partial [Candidatus Latescibacteria bacterium]|nr:PAS domain-containing protein [bacterium]MBD3424286.1 PAS domain-containing protein [Candidatus Latescibacterota bacterium]